MPGGRKKYCPHIWKFRAGKAHLRGVLGEAAWWRQSLGHQRMDRVPMGRVGTAELLKVWFEVRQGTFFHFSAAGLLVSAAKFLHL